MKNKKYLIFLITAMFLTSAVGCTKEEEVPKTVVEESEYSELMNYEEALELFAEGVEATIYDIETGISYDVRRIVGGYTTIADIETLTLEDTEKLLETSGGNWSIYRRSVIVTIGDINIAASIAPFEHSGDENYEYGEIIDNRSGATGSGINLDSISDNGMIGVVDIYFYNSLIPGYGRIDERHQEMVLEAYEYKG
ncbi:MAG: hypothetical protein R3Y13_05205 [bacterium]